MTFTPLKRRKFEQVCIAVHCTSTVDDAGYFRAKTAPEFDGQPWASDAAAKALFTYLGPTISVEGYLDTAGRVTPGGTPVVVATGENGRLELRGFRWGGLPGEDLPVLTRFFRRLGLPEGLADAKLFRIDRPWNFTRRDGQWLSL